MPHYAHLVHTHTDKLLSDVNRKEERLWVDISQADNDLLLQSIT